MKAKNIVSFLAVAACLSSTASAALLLSGFHSFNELDTPEGADEGVFAGVVTKGGASSRSSGGSTDDFYGNSTFAAPENDGYARISNSFLTFSFTNSTGNNYTLESLLFDATKSSNVQFISVGYSINGGQLQNITSYTPANTVTPTGTTSPQDMSDYAKSLGITLNAGSLITFQFSATGGSAGARIDNVALTGDLLSPIPEPGSIMALGGLLGSGFLLRQRRRA